VPFNMGPTNRVIDKVNHRWLWIYRIHATYKGGLRTWRTLGKEWGRRKSERVKPTWHAVQVFSTVGTARHIPSPIQPQ
jgi:hypothetical protein